MNILKIRKGSNWVLTFLAAMILQPSAMALPIVGDPPNADTDKFSEWSVVGPSGGDVRVVTVDPKDKNRLYISTLDGQIHTSADGGKTWSLLVNLNKPQLILDQLFVDSRDSKIIYASGHRHKAPGGFFRSTDRGVTWKESKELKGEFSCKGVDALLNGARSAKVNIKGTFSAQR